MTVNTQTGAGQPQEIADFATVVQEITSESRRAILLYGRERMIVTPPEIYEAWLDESAPGALSEACGEAV
jgi:hypothetical protein